MDILYTSFLQRLVHASSAVNQTREVKDKELLELLIHLKKMIRTQENMTEEFTRQSIAQRNAGAPA